MKKLMYLFVVAIMFAFTACGGGENATEETAVEAIVICADNCQKACCLGCKATEGAAKCIVLADGSMPCCVSNEVSSEEGVYDHNESHGHEH